MTTMHDGYKYRSFNINTAKSFIGKTVNLYLKDKSVMACVTVVRVTNSQIFFKASKHGKLQSYKLSEISRAEGVMLYDKI
jgi:uncharacterized protein YpmS